jgi:transposase
LAIQLTDILGIKVSKNILRRFLHRLDYTWKRFRKSFWKKQDPIEYEKKLAELKQLIQLYLSVYIDLYFADESGFNMEGYVPYGWQPKGEYIEITPAKTKGTQVFGLMSLDNQLHSYTFKGSTNSQMVISFLEDFRTGIKKRTVVVMDNAPIHRSKEFESKIENWKEDDLFIFFLPKYSPHLNPIEILWRMIKYRWLPYEILESQVMLDQSLDQILQGFGSEYTINFKEHKKNVSNIFV